MLAATCRAGPSSLPICQNGFKGSTLQPRRYLAKVAKNPPSKKNPNFRGPTKDNRGLIIPKNKETKLGAFKALSPGSLTHPLFESTKREALLLPPFIPTVGNIGEAAEFSVLDNGPVRIFGVPKKMLLEFRLLSKPCCVIRDVTVETTELLGKARDMPSTDTRFILSGRSGCGKSYLLLQAVEHCVSNGWIVLYIPRAVNLVNSTTSHEYDLRTRTYLQSDFSFQTLQRLRTVNLTALTGLTTKQKHIFEKREIPLGTNLADLIGIALKEPHLSPLILEVLMAELDAQTKFPVLLAVDDVQALYCRTAYRDPHFAPIRPYHLSIPRLILEYASGKRSFSKGAFLGAITNSDTNYKPPLELIDALNLPHEQPDSPYHKRSSALIEYTKGLQTLRVPDQLRVTEAASLFEVWMKDKALVPSTYDEMFLAKYTESSGNARDFVWKGLLGTLVL